MLGTTNVYAVSGIVNYIDPKFAWVGWGGHRRAVCCRVCREGL